MEEDWEEEEEEIEGGEARGWAVVMPPTMTAQRTAALQLCDCLQSAPPLETVQKLEDKLPKYKGVPSTPAPPETSEESPAFCNAENVVRDHADDCGPLRERGGSQLAASSSLG